MNDENWLTSLKVGDEVALYQGYAGRSRVDTVARITATQIILTGRVRIRRSTGRELGACGLSRATIRELTPSLRESIAHMDAVERLSNTQWENKPMAVVMAIVRLLESKA